MRRDKRGVEERRQERDREKIETCAPDINTKQSKKVDYTETWPVEKKTREEKGRREKRECRERLKSTSCTGGWGGGE